VSGTRQGWLNVDTNNRTILLGLAGDVIIDRDDPHEVFSEVRELLQEPDILFANLEAPYSDARGMAITAPLVIVPRAHKLDAYERAGFHVVSMANNHIVDGGHAAMLETRDRLVLTITTRWRLARSLLYEAAYPIH
jgi:poly-gamma-glutamate capsule biosynthesis protein CapA/YwtB (metallophosphatase superfamily)